MKTPLTDSVPSHKYQFTYMWTDDQEWRPSNLEQEPLEDSKYAPMAEQASPHALLSLSSFYLVFLFAQRGQTTICIFTKAIHWKHVQLLRLHLNFDP